MNTKVLVTDAGHKNALASIRSLGKKGVYVTGVSNMPKWKTLGFYSKYCKKKIVFNENLSNIDKYANKLLNLLDEDNYDVLLPIGLKSYLATSKHKKEFLNLTNIIVPDYDKIEIAYNKDRTMEFAKKIGIPAPKTVTLNNHDDLNNINEFPIVLKSSGDSGIFVKYCNNKIELKKNFKILKDNSKTNIIAQEYIKGFGCGFYGIYNKGKLISYFMHKRIKEFPITGGPSAVAESYYDKRLFVYGKKLCGALKWHGPIMAEFKYDILNNDYKLIEINPKLWGSLDLTIEAGIDVPNILVNLALRKEIHAENYRDIRYRWIFPDEFLVVLSKRVSKDFFSFNTKTNIYFDDLKPTFFQINQTIIDGFKVLTNKSYRLPHGEIK